MPPIVPLMVDDPLLSMLPVLLKPLPVMAYVTAFSVTPGAASKFKPSEPACSSAALLSGSLEQAMKAAPIPSANEQTRGTLPSLLTSPDLPRQFFINRSFVVVVQLARSSKRDD